MRRTISKALAVGILASFGAWAEDDEPGRGVARLSLIYGDVSVRRGDSGDWVAANVNAPLVVEDHVMTGANSRAELQFDWANMLRLGSNADVRLAALDNRRYQVQVARGTVTMRVLRDSDAEIEVDTPNVSVRPNRKGTYRVEVNDNGETEVTVRSGEAEVYTPRGVERLRSGRTMLVRGTSSDPEYQIVDARSRDDWDRWNEDRDRRLERSRSYAYVSRDIYGADELDDHGRWVYAPPYGYVWSPYGVGPDWAPYRYGRWSWIDWYGWSWVSYDPWGWAPYHYGRWFHHAPYGWCWYPGPIHHRHYWRPALVAFFGFHAGPVHIGFGFGRIGWVPLAPYEPYYPWYGRRIYGGYRNRTYIDNSVRIVNNVNITNVYRNARVRNGLSGLDADGFVRGRPGRVFEGQDIDVRRANLVQGAVPMTPTRESLRMSDREARVNPGRVREAQFFSRRQPERVERVPFEQQRQGMDTMVRRTFGESRGERGEVAGGAVPRGADRGQAGQEVAIPRGAGVRSEPSAAGQDQRGWRRMGESRSGGAGEPARVETRGDNDWRRLGGRVLSEPRSEQGGAVEPRRDPGSGSDWRRFGGRGSSEPQAPQGGAVEPRRDASSSSDWRRFGGRTSSEPRSEGGGSIEPRRDPGSGSDWRRFGGRSSEETPRPDFGRRESDESWRRSAPTRSGGDEPRVREIPRSEPRGGSERWGGPSRSERNDAPRFDRPEAIRINPPIVRERSGGFGGRDMGGSRGGGGMSRDSGGSRGGGEIRGGGGGSGRTSGGGGERGGGGGRVRGGRDR